MRIPGPNDLGFPGISSPPKAPQVDTGAIAAVAASRAAIGSAFGNLGEALGGMIGKIGAADAAVEGARNDLEYDKKRNEAWRTFQDTEDGSGSAFQQFNKSLAEAHAAHPPVGRTAAERSRKEVERARSIYFDGDRAANTVFRPAAYKKKIGELDSYTASALGEIEAEVTRARTESAGYAAAEGQQLDAQTLDANVYGISDDVPTRQRDHLHRMIEAWGPDGKNPNGTVFTKRQVDEAKKRVDLAILQKRYALAPAHEKQALQEQILGLKREEAPSTASGGSAETLTSGVARGQAHGWARSNATWQGLNQFEKAAAMALMEADGMRGDDAKNALGAMINRAAKGNEDLGAHVSRKIYQPTMERSQEARLNRIINDPKFKELTSWAQRRAAGQEADPVNGSTHFLAPERTMLALESREPNKYRSWRSWTGYDAGSGQYRGVITRDGSHAFLAPEGRFSLGGAGGPLSEVKAKAAVVGNDGGDLVIEDGGKRFAIPRQDRDGNALSDEQAIAQYRKTGEKYGEVKQASAPAGRMNLGMGGVLSGMAETEAEREVKESFGPPTENPNGTLRVIQPPETGDDGIIRNQPFEKMQNDGVGIESPQQAQKISARLEELAGEDPNTPLVEVLSEEEQAALPPDLQQAMAADPGLTIGDAAGYVKQMAADQPQQPAEGEPKPPAPVPAVRPEEPQKPVDINTLARQRFAPGQELRIGGYRITSDLLNSMSEKERKALFGEMSQQLTTQRRKDTYRATFAARNAEKEMLEKGSATGYNDQALKAAMAPKDYLDHKIKLATNQSIYQSRASVAEDGLVSFEDRIAAVKAQPDTVLPPVAKAQIIAALDKEYTAARDKLQPILEGGGENRKYDPVAVVDGDIKHSAVKGFRASTATGKADNPALSEGLIDARIAAQVEIGIDADNVQALSRRERAKYAPTLAGLTEDNMEARKTKLYNVISADLGTKHASKAMAEVIKSYTRRELKESALADIDRERPRLGPPVPDDLPSRTNPGVSPGDLQKRYDLSNPQMQSTLKALIPNWSQTQVPPPPKASEMPSFNPSRPGTSSGAATARAIEQGARAGSAPYPYKTDGSQRWRPSNAQPSVDINEVVRGFFAPNPRNPRYGGR